MESMYQVISKYNASMTTILVGVVSVMYGADFAKLSGSKIILPHRVVQERLYFLATMCGRGNANDTNGPFIMRNYLSIV